MDLETKLFWASLDFLTVKRLKLFTEHFGNLENAQKHFSPEEFYRAGISQESIDVFLQRKRELNFTKTQKDFEKAGAKLFFYEDEQFPKMLKQISSSPIFLFVKGEILPEDGVSLSVVGTRKASSHGKQAISHFLPDIVSAGFTIVSGMARGIDTEAHRETLKRRGRTIAVWGTGIDRVYPIENHKLAQRIEENGAILSEFPLGTEPYNYNFPRRNRLISGFSLGTLVVEGKEKSGSIITALLALEQGKEVFAVPGSPFYRLSEATNNLIRKGEAKLVQSSIDILDEFPFVQKTKRVRKFLPENELERIVFNILSTEPMTFDDLVYQTEKTSYELSAVLVTMVMKGVVKDLGMNRWVRNW